MANLDSQAVFEARSLELGVTPTELTVIRDKNWAAYGKFAFSCHFAPGNADEMPFIKMVAEVTGSGANNPPEDRLPIFRRLFWEAYTMAAAEMRARVEQRDSDLPRKLAAPERATRHEDQQLRILSIKMEDEFEPSHALIDAVVQLSEDNQLKYVSWQQCTKRLQELSGIKVDPYWKPDANGVVKQIHVPDEIRADVSENLLLRNALTRRSLAFDQCRLIDFQKMEDWHNIMLAALLQQPIKGFSQVTLEQLNRADLALFHYMMRATRKGIRMLSNGTFPLEDAIVEASKAVEVRLLLQPLQGASSKRKADDAFPSNEHSNKNKSDRQAETIKQLQNRVAKLQSNTGDNDNKRTGDKRGSKGSGKSSKPAARSAFIRMPSDLRGMEPMTADGEPICFSFNLGGCDRAAPGEKCPKGWHKCCRKGCNASHSQKNHV